MSAIAGVFGPCGVTEPVVRAMFARMPQRGEGGGVVRAGDEAILGVARFAWELDPELAGPIHVAQHDGLVVAADATLYYRDELRAKLTRAGVVPSGPTHSHLILDAYRAWGAACAEHLEGDYAFVVWDTRRSEVFCCRDGIGLRPLHYGVFDRTLVVASSVAGVLAHPHASDELNLRSIGAVVAGLTFSLGAETSFRDVHALPAGHTLRWSAGTLQGLTRHFTPAPQSEAGRLSFRDAADELRRLLTQAVAERLPTGGVAAVWMSGGWDSTAVFAAGKDAIQRGRRPVSLRPVSISYPPRDPGREDDLIQSVLDRWGVTAHWMQSRDMPLFADLENAAGRRDEAAELMYGPWNAALAAGSRAAGARIAFDGNGGDQLFGPNASDWANLVVTGRWWSLAREWWVARPMGFANLLRKTFDPLLPIAKRHFRRRPLSSWVRPEFVRDQGLIEFDRALLPQPGFGVAARDQVWSLAAPYIAWAMSRIAELALAQGIELRSPLLDTRVMAFAMARPWHERGRRWETKRLLRAAMRDLLPAAFLAPRGRRTGMTTGYSRYWMEQRYPELFERLFAEPLQLAALGVVDGDALRRGADDAIARRADVYTRMNLFHALEVEHWLRARASRRITTEQPLAVVHRDRAEVAVPRRSHSFHLTAGG